MPGESTDGVGRRVALVTGAAGQDGGYLCERLLADGYEVHGTVRASENDVSACPWLASVTLHPLDLTDVDAIARVVAQVEPHEVYNLAAISSVYQSWRQPVLTTQVNGTAVAALLQACLDVQLRLGRPVRVVQASSAEIFGAARDVPQREDTPLAPVSPYGAGKALAHHLVGVYRSHELHASACVLFPHESVRRPATFVSRKITSTVAAIAAGRADRLVLGDLNPSRDWGWAPDYVDAMIRAARYHEAVDFVVATGQSHSVQDFVEAAFAAAGVPDWRRYVTHDSALRRPAEVSRQVGDASRARDLLGWEPTLTFDAIVKTMVAADLAALDHQ